MSFIHYVSSARGPSREKLLRGEVPVWIKNSRRHKYIAQVVMSAPPWVDRKELRRLMLLAQERTQREGELYVLDHRVPLNHPRVCGLTVPWNLRIVHWLVNARKGNSWDPDQQDMFELGAGQATLFELEEAHDG